MLIRMIGNIIEMFTQLTTKIIAMIFQYCQFLIVGREIIRNIYSITLYVGSSVKWGVLELFTYNILIQTTER